MNTYITGETIKRLREEKKLTQAALAEKLGVSDKAVSKWETGKSYPDITLIEPIAATLGVSVVELFSGGVVTNSNRSFNMKRAKFYVCPVCGNVIVSTGETVVCCCALTLPPLEAEDAECDHEINIETVEDEYYVTIDHPMSKEHNISFLAALTDCGMEIVKLYPEQICEARFKIRRTHAVFAYCNRHGLFKAEIRKKKK